MATTDPNPSPEWTTVSEDEADDDKFQFDLIGEELIGTYLGTRQLSNEQGAYTQYRYELSDGQTVFVNGNYSLQAGMRNVRIGNLCRITFTGEKDTGQASLLKLFRVDVAKRNVKPAKGQPGAAKTPASS